MSRQEPRRDTVSNSPLHEAAYHNDLRELRQLLAGPAGRKRVNLRNHLGCTPLRLAAAEGHRAAAELLLASGAEVDAVDIKQQTPLFVAAKNDAPRCAELLARHGADPDGCSGCLSTPLYVAAMHGRTQCLQVLVAAGADVDRCIFSFRPAGGVPCTALSVSFTYRHLDCFTALLRAGADPDCGQSRGDVLPTLLDKAVERGEVRFIRPLVEFGATLTLNPSCHPVQIMVGGPGRDQHVVAYLAENVPQNLQSLCRIAARRCLGARRLTSVAQLPLPTCLKNYLLHRA